jgi:hypothetical protein
MGMIDFRPEKKFERFFVRQGFPPFSESPISISPPPYEHLGLFWREKYPKFVLNATIGVKIPTR